VSALFSIELPLRSKPPRCGGENSGDGHEWKWCAGYRSGTKDQRDHGGAPFKKLRPPQVTPLPFEQIQDLELVCEMDEQWSFVGKKSEQRWLWYAWSPHFNRVFAYTLGRRVDESLRQLLGLLQRFSFRLYCTDDWGAYERLLPEDKHLITKRYTQSIERQNLNFRTHLKRLARRTLCFSKSVDIHDKVIGEYIARHSFN
jgi:insertion element IS1 protein InsB